MFNGDVSLRFPQARVLVPVVLLVALLGALGLLARPADAAGRPGTYNPYAGAYEPYDSRLIKLVARTTPRAARSPAAGATMIGQQCSHCHQTDALFSHPVNVVPTLSIPADMPLEGGKITCITCHENTSVQHAGGRTEHTQLLRGGLSGVAFCTQCHSSSAVTRKDQHGANLGVAHLEWPGKPRGKHDETRNCLSCHDGTVAGDSFAESHDQTPAIGRSHSVGTRYNPGLLGDRALVAAPRLDRRIRLFSGSVGCGSCHSPFSQEKSLLVMSNDSSKLCMSCHEMR